MQELSIRFCCSAQLAIRTSLLHARNSRLSAARPWSFFKLVLLC